MIPQNLIFLQVVPLDKYFLWQVEVQIHNFRKFNISQFMEILVWYPEDRTEEVESWKQLQKEYPEVKIFFYQDSGVNLGLYISQLRPHTLKKHFIIFKEEFKDKVFFYHDSDIIFNFLPDFEVLCNDSICWQSNCSHYLDYPYMERKEKQGEIPDNEAIKKFAEIGRVTPEIIKSYSGKTGGAQCILKDIDYSFWDDIERQVVEIRVGFFYGIKGSINNKYFKSEAEGFQSWCADMWALNFALWSRGIETNVTKDLDFSWATDNMDTYLKKAIFHNAGAINGNGGLFYKGDYIKKSPFDEELQIPAEDKASRMYVLAINEVKNEKLQKKQ